MPGYAVQAHDLPALSKIASYYANRFSQQYHVSADDLQQDAWVAIMTAAKSWDPNKSASFSHYARCAVIRVLYGSAMRAKSSFSGGLRLKKGLKSLVSASQQRKQTPVEDTVLGTAPSPEEMYADMQLARDLRERIRAAAGETHADVATWALLAGVPARDITAKYSCTKWFVHDLRRRVRRALAQDRLIQQHR